MYWICFIVAARNWLGAISQFQGFFKEMELASDFQQHSKASVLMLLIMFPEVFHLG